MKSVLVLLVSGLCLQPSPLAAQDAQGIAAISSIERVFIEVIARVEPSIVSVARVRPAPDPNQFNPLDLEIEGRGDRNGPETPDFVPNEFGAGIIVAPLRGSQERFIITNYHVVRGGPAVGATSKPADNQVYVRFGDRRGYYAHIIAGDPRSDLAVLSIDYAALGLKAADLRADSSADRPRPASQGPIGPGIREPVCHRAGRVGQRELGHDQQRRPPAGADSTAGAGHAEIRDDPPVQVRCCRSIRGWSLRNERRVSW